MDGAEGLLPFQEKLTHFRRFQLLISCQFSKLSLERGMEGKREHNF